MGDTGAEQLLKETIEAGLKLKAVKAFMLKRINVDTTVQEKEVRFPTDSRLYDRARQRLVIWFFKIDYVNLKRFRNHINLAWLCQFMTLPNHISMHCLGKHRTKPYLTKRPV